MFAGKPIVCSGVGGVPEIIEHGTEGLILDGFDIKMGQTNYLSYYWIKI